MKLSYQVATPDVRCGESVTAYQGSIEKTFSDIASMGYDGVELMTLDPAKLDRVYIKELARQLGISCEMVCTGEMEMPVLHHPTIMRTIKAAHCI